MNELNKKVPKSTKNANKKIIFGNELEPAVIDLKPANMIQLPKEEPTKCSIRDNGIV